MKSRNVAATNNRRGTWVPDGFAPAATFEAPGRLLMNELNDRDLWVRLCMGQAGSSALPARLESRHPSDCRRDLASSSVANASTARTLNMNRPRPVARAVPSERAQTGVRLRNNLTNKLGALIPRLPAPSERDSWRRSRFVPNF